jgi:glycosyltransferase involved in cell wall biosynthesis
MRAGTPVVASRVGGLPELVRDGVDGFLVDPGDVDGLRTAVSRLLDSPSRRAQMGAQACERATTTFAPSVVIPKIEALYQDVLAGGSR